MVGRINLRISEIQWHNLSVFIGDPETVVTERSNGARVWKSYDPLTGDRIYSWLERFDSPIV